MAYFDHPRKDDCLSRLPQEILLAICERIEVQSATITTVPRLERHVDAGFYEWCYRGGDLFPLSMTCRLLRTLCLPIIFKACVLDEYTEDRVVPQFISVFTRRLYIHRVRMTPPRFRDYLRTMPNVCEVHITDSPHLLCELLESDSLRVLALHAVSLSAPLTSFAPAPGPLRTLRLLPRDRLRSLHKRLETEEKQILAETEWLHSLLPLVRPTLEELFLPAESTRLSLLCAAPWPLLKELVLIGALAMADTSLLDLLVMLPRLEALAILVIYHRDTPRLLVWPPHTHSLVDLSGIRRLALSTASEDDEVFVRLSPSLEELSLRDHPRLYSQNRLSKPLRPHVHYSMHSLTCSAALGILKRLDLACLRRLELVVIGDHRVLELLSHLASTCTTLVSLELHLYRDVSDTHALMHDPPCVPLTTLATTLSTLKGLSVLRLNLEYPHSQVRWTSIGPISFADTSARFSEGVARAVALHMPQLRTIGVLGLIGNNDVGWRMWTIGEQNGALTLTLDCTVRAW